MNRILRSKLTALLLAGAMLMSLAACDTAADSYTDPEDNSSTSQPAEDIEVQHADFENVQEYVQNGATYVVLSGSSVVTEGTGCVIDGSTLTITREGTYILSGNLSGQVVIDAGGEKIRLVFNGVDITCPNSSPLYIKDAKKVTLTLADGTENILTDGESYDYDNAASEEPSAALFSKADLIIEGGGSLTVNASFNNGIQSKDTLEIHSGNYVINAANHGITGKDSLAIKDGSFAITAGGDGMRSNNADDSSLGWVDIAGGSFAINAGQDGVQAETTLHIGGGSFAVTTGGGSANSSSNGDGWGDWEQGNNMPPGGFGGFGGGRSAGSTGTSDSTSAKAFKAGSNVLIEDGVIAIDSSDDALHSNGSLAITGGTVEISSGDDGIHADSAMSISGGSVTIAKSYEGIEGVSVSISGGSLTLTSSDDGINSAGGSDGGHDRPGANMFAVDENCDVTISGGVSVINASGDGIDSNGNIHISGGTLVLNGPTNSGNGALDYAGECIVTGGHVAVSGSSGMAQGASRSSTQANMLLCFNGTVEGGTMLALTDGSGNVVFAATPEKDYASMFISVPGMSVGDSYTLWLGGSCDGETVNGICTGGKLTGATEITEVTVSEISTYYGGSSGMGGPGGMGGHGGGHGPGR